MEKILGGGRGKGEGRMPRKSLLHQGAVKSILWKRPRGLNPKFAAVLGDEFIEKAQEAMQFPAKM